MMEDLRIFKESKTLVTIKREAIDAFKIQGFLLAYSANLILIQYVYDFKLDGLMVLRVSDVTDIESSKTDIFQTQVLKDEGLYGAVDFSKEYAIADWRSVLLTIGEESGIVTIEDEDPEFPSFYIGELRSIGEDSVSILQFSGAANWHDEESEIFYENISSFQVGNNYAEAYKRYFNQSAAEKL